MEPIGERGEPKLSGNDPVTILFNGGRLDTWHRLSAEQRRDYEQEHVDLMLGIASKWDLRRLEGFRLVAPQGDWERSWIIEFPTMAGAEAWIAAEMAPPYGRYGFYDYHLARQVQTAEGIERPHIQTGSVAIPKGDPHQVPKLTIEKEGVVVFLFIGGGLGDQMVPNVHASALARAKMHGVIRLEQFDSIAPRADWSRAWLVELPTLDSAEAWIEDEVAACQGDMTRRCFQLTRKWAPDYFRRWIPH